MSGQICNHMWIVTSWNISEHSESAQELMCQKCGAFVDHDGLQLLRINYKIGITSSPVPNVSEIQSTQ
jgi:hypothetical protein